MRLYALFFLLLAAAVSAATSEAETRISGTYVTHGATFAELLQLTQTENGQITGVLSEVALQPDEAVMRYLLLLIVLLAVFGLEIAADFQLPGVWWTHKEAMAYGGIVFGPTIAVLILPRRR